MIRKCILKLLLSENKYNETLLKGKRFDFVCVNFEDRVLTMKDRERDMIVEIRLVNIGSKDWRLSCSCKCSKCESGNCDHALFALYSPAIGILRDLYFLTHSDKLRIPERIRNRFRFEQILVKMVIPLWMIWMFSMEVVPIMYDPNQETFRTTLSQILGLMPLVPPPGLV